MTDVCSLVTTLNTISICRKRYAKENFGKTKVQSWAKLGQGYFCAQFAPLDYVIQLNASMIMSSGRKTSGCHSPSACSTSSTRQRCRPGEKIKAMYIPFSVPKPHDTFSASPVSGSLVQKS